MIMRPSGSLCDSRESRLADPIGEGIENLASHLVVRASASYGHVKRMICVGQQAENRAVSEMFDYARHQVRIGESVAGALEEQHRNPNIEQVAGAIVGRLAGRMERKSQKYQPANFAQRRDGLGLRRHPPAERLATGKEWNTGELPIGFLDGCANGRVRDRRRIRSPGTVLHVGELEAQRRDAAGGEFPGGSGHESVGHSGASAVRQNQAGPRRIRTVQKPGDKLGLAYLDGETIRADWCALHGAGEGIEPSHAVRGSVYDCFPVLPTGCQIECR